MIEWIAMGITIGVLEPMSMRDTAATESTAHANLCCPTIDQARPEADSCRSAYSIQGHCHYR
jgi:hypothetical protein